MKNEKISVVIGTYNQLKFLKKAIKGWRNQTYKNFKLYLCDDGSSDGTKAWAEKQDDIKYFWQEDKGMRLAKSLNNAFRVAKGEYVLTVMADSVPREDYLERFVPYLKKNWVLCGVRENVSEDLDHIGWDWRYRLRHNQLGWNFAGIQAFQWARITGNGLVVPMWALKKIGYWPEDFVGYSCEDNLVGVKLFAEGLEFADVPKAVIMHIEHDAREDSEKNLKLFRRRSKQIFDDLKEKLRPQTVCLNFDDFSPVNNNLYFLRKLRENYPNLKVSLFTIPATVQTGKLVTLFDRPRFCDELRQETDWLEFLPHGWHHPNMSQAKSEFADMTYLEAQQYIKLVDKLFKKVDLPYKKIFKAPQFRISNSAKDAFAHQGWALAIDGTGEFWPENIKTIHYNWNIMNPFPLRKKVVSYGHIQDIGNGLHQCWERLLEMPTDANFVFMSELL